MSSPALLFSQPRMVGVISILDDDHAYRVPMQEVVFALYIVRQNSNSDRLRTNANSIF